MSVVAVGAQLLLVCCVYVTVALVTRFLSTTQLIIQNIINHFFVLPCQWFVEFLNEAALLHIRVFAQPMSVYMCTKECALLLQLQINNIANDIHFSFVPSQEKSVTFLLFYKVLLLCSEAALIIDLNWLRRHKAQWSSVFAPIGLRHTSFVVIFSVVVRF